MATATHYPGTERYGGTHVFRLAFIYPAVVLVVLALQDSILQSVTALCLAIFVFVAGMTAHPRLLIAASSGCFFFIVAAAEPHLGHWSVLAAAPTLVPLLHGFRLMADPATLPYHPGSSFSPTTTGWTLLLGLATLSVLGIAAGSTSLLLGTAAVCAVVAIPTAVWAWRLHGASIVIESEPISLVAGNAAIRDVRVSTPTGVLLALSLDHPIAHVTPSTMSLGPSGTILTIAVRPLLSGPHKVTASACVADPLGLVATSRNVDLLPLTVVPRARALELAALRFLRGQNESGATMSAAISGALPHLLMRDSGVEYAGSRLYIPGDELHSIDWKHSAKLQRAVVKRYSSPAQAKGILIVNRTVADEDEADRLAYELLSAALTLAREGLGAAVIAYDSSDDAVAPARVLTGRDLVQHALELTGSLLINRRYRRLLDVRSVQTLMALKARSSAQAETSSTVRVLEVAEQSLSAAVEAHPLTSALRHTSRDIHPDWCLAMSNMGSDAEALVTGLQRLEKAVGARTLLLDVRSGVHGALQRQARRLA